MPILIVLGLCIVPMYLNIILSQILVAAKRQVAWTWVMGGATILNPLAEPRPDPGYAVALRQRRHRCRDRLAAHRDRDRRRRAVLIGRGVLDDGLVRRAA